MAERQFPAAVINPESQPYWDAAAKGKLLIKFCNSCKKHFFYPRSICPRHLMMLPRLIRG